MATFTLIIQILFFIVLIAGIVAQRAQRYKLHDRLQAPVVILNIFFIIFVMVPTFRSVVVDNGNFNEVPTMVTAVHGTLGLIAQGLAIYCLLAGFKILPRKIGVLRYWMWATFVAWTATLLFGVGVYLFFHTEILATDSGASSQPEGVLVAEHDEALTEEAASPPTDEPAAPPDESPAETTELVPDHDEEIAAEPEPAPAEPEPAEETAETEADDTTTEEPAASDTTGPMVDTDTFLMEELIDEHMGDIAEIEEPVFTGQAAQAQWQALQPANVGPGPRYEHALQYNAQTNQLFLFGGRDGSQIFNDLWVMDLATLTWRQLAIDAAVAPPARFSTVMIVDDAAQNLYVATGHTQGGKNFNDIWKLDLATETWTDLTGLAGAGPTARYGSPGGNLGGNLVTTHGFGGTRYDDTWRFNTSTETWENVTPPGSVPLKRCLFAASPSGANLVIHGGCASGFGDCFLEDTWLLDSESNVWREVLSDLKPVGRQYQSLVADAADPNRLVLFGGQDATRAARNDLWLLDLTTGGWQLVDAAGGPEARYQHAAVWIPGQGMLIYGGRGTGALGDMWLLSNPPAEPPTPEPEPTAVIEATSTPLPAPTSTPVPEPTSTPELISEHDGE